MMADGEDNVSAGSVKSITCPALRGEKITELRCRMKKKRRCQILGRSIEGNDRLPLRKKGGRNGGDYR